MAYGKNIGGHARAQAALLVKKRGTRAARASGKLLGAPRVAKSIAAHIPKHFQFGHMGAKH